MSFLEKKVPPPVVALITALLMWWLSRYLPGVDLSERLKTLIVILLAVLAVLIDATAIVSFFAAKTTVNPMKPASTSRLVTSGIYRFSRNPMYLGLAIWLAVWGIYLSAPITLICLVFFVCYINRFQIKPEERALLQLFGDDYRNYKMKVRRWL